jgi:hypothetical protein
MGHGLSLAAPAVERCGQAQAVANNLGRQLHGPPEMRQRLVRLALLLKRQPQVEVSDYVIGIDTYGRHEVVDGLVEPP